MHILKGIYIDRGTRGPCLFWIYGLDNNMILTPGFLGLHEAYENHTWFCGYWCQMEVLITINMHLANDTAS